MLESLHWQVALKSTEAGEQLNELQADALHLFVLLATAGYVVWHGANTLGHPSNEVMLQTYTVALVAAPVLAGTYAMLRWSQQVAAALFVGGGLVAVSWALYILGTSRVAILYAMIALIAAFVIHPLGGFVVVGASAGMLSLLGAVRPGLIHPVDGWYAVGFGAMAVVGVWALARHLFLVLNWHVDSYADAERQRREAQEHRARLVQAWKQLDSAYYRLERANAALRLAWEVADRAERSKTELVANISHELRTPLNLVVGFSEMMLTSPGSYGGAPLPVPYYGDLNAIYRSAQHLLALTDDIIDLARMEIGRLGLLREPVDLTEVVRDTVAVVKDYAEAKGLELRVELPESLPALILDRTRIRQVLLNLLTNAVRLTEHGRIEVRLLSREQDVQVSISDTGPGIAPEEQARIFQRYETRGKPEARGSSGIGLGLPISKQFVELHGGRMWVESVPGAGATFSFTLPLVPAEGFGAAPVAPGVHPGYLRPPEKVVVLARADPGLLRLFRRHLEGYAVEAADGMADAEVRALELKAAAIIVDLDTPEGPAPGLVPVVRCPLPDVSRVAEGLAVADYLVKPISREALLGAVQKLSHPINRVLIVDDDLRFVRLVARMLSSAGCDYAISTAHNGEDALTRLTADRPDLLLLDLGMPGLDGFGVLRHMATEPDLKDVKVIVISAQGEGEALVPLGTEIRISKPEGFHLAELFQTIDAAVSRMAPVRGYLAGIAPAPPKGPPD